MESDTKRYLDQHSINRLFKDMLTCLLEDRPTDPIEYMIDGLKALKSAPTAPRPVSFLNFFQARTDGEPSGEAETVQLDLDSLQALSMQQSDDAGAPLPAEFCTTRRQSVSAESFQPRIIKDEAYDTVVIPKAPGARERIEEAVKDNLLFRNLDSDQRRRILDAMFERQVQANETIIRQGDPGDNFYVIESGKFQVLVNGEQKETLDSGKTFGELALMYNCPRAATITALESGTLWAVDRTTFTRTVIDLAYRKRKMYEGFLRSVPILRALTDTEIGRIADALEPVEFATGDVILKEGDIGLEFYMIVSGQVSVSQNGTQIRELHCGDHFGEKALLEHIPRTATVTALSDVKCVVLLDSAFQRLLGPLKELMLKDQARITRYVR